MDKKESARLGHVLETALNIFSRYGYRKTSIEDIATAAGISRQGIYLHFKNKESIFSASIQKTIYDGLQVGDQILDDDALSLEEKLFKALDEWFGRHAGLLLPEASDLAAQCQRVLGDVIATSNSSFQTKLQKIIQASSVKESTESVKDAAIIAEILFACGSKWKHSCSSRHEFMVKMSDAIHLCCRDLSNLKEATNKESN
ncbi:TetR/AcrR family transcriptional regulator [Paenibacillus psychroresistens]|uniref:TetR/AcrR family transcriptional regulator n=1 Tax=Paenibacillus psychroresistens TaxID=1778678 RepID=A0A6B8RH81_9BACL|nr:TetR/AcrR family transcriptional regulator [Paenibacillus psychroresistens]QGQ95084.1 TetR/AcrR family transcriptional regulator [Paenibacillus psychroresistens]